MPSLQVTVRSKDKKPYDNKLTSKQPAQGFMERAFNDTKNEVKQTIAEVIREELNL
jgi:HK97 gp10 family phage protein